MGRIKDLSDVKKPPGAQLAIDAQGREHIIFAGGEEMTEEARKARRAYKREWNKKNRDKVKAAQDRYWEKKAREARDQGQRDGEN